jgi:hypothetical protein
LLQLWREMNIHLVVRILSCPVSLARLLRLSKDVNVGHASAIALDAIPC